MSEFNWDLNVLVNEILDEAKADKVDQKIRKQKEEWEKPVKITLSADEVVKQLKDINAQAKNINDNLNNKALLGKGFKDIQRNIDSYKELKRRAEELYPAIHKNNKAYKENQAIFKATEKIIDSLTVSQKESSKIQSDAAKNAQKASKIAVDGAKAQEKTLEGVAKVQEKAAKIAVDGAKKENVAINTTTQSVIKSIDSYEGLVAVIKEYVSLSKQLKPSHTSEYEEIQRVMDSVRTFDIDGKEGLIAEIQAAYKNVQQAKSSKKNNLSVYRHTQSNGNTYENSIWDYDKTINELTTTLNGYIYHAFDGWGQEILEGFGQKRIRDYVQKQIDNFIKIDSTNNKYQLEVEEFNEPFYNRIKEIRSMISPDQSDMQHYVDVMNVLDELRYRANDVNRHTLSVETNKLGKLLGISTPYQEIENNAKRIESYEELCNVVARYNELAGQNIIYSGDKGFQKESDELEFKTIQERFRASGIDKIWNYGWDNISDESLEKLAKHLNLISPNVERLTQEAQQLGEYFEKNHQLIAKSESGLNRYSELFTQVSSGAMTAADAINVLNKEIVENKALTSPAATKTSYTSSLSDQALSGLLKGVDLKALTKDITLSQENRAKLDGQIADWAKLIEQAAMGDRSAEVQEAIWNQADKIVDLIVSQGTYKVDNHVDKQRYAEFLAHFKANPIKYTDAYKTEFGDDWRSIISRYGGNNKILTKDSSALTINEQWSELKELFSDILTSNAENEKQQLKDVLDTVQIARDVQKARKTLDASLTDSDRSALNSQVNDVMNGIWLNAEKIHQTEQQITAEDKKQIDAESKSAQETAKTVATKKEELATEQAITKEKQRQAGTKKKASDETVKPEPTPIVDTDTKRALEQLRQAESNKTPLIDLSGVYNTDDLTKELRGMAQTAWSEKGFTVDRIKVEGSTAAIKLYNKELEMSITQTYKMDAANEEAAASLKHLKDAYDYNVKALRGQEIDVDFEKRFAQAQIDNLIQPLKGAQYDGESNLRALASDIVDDKSLKAFNNEMKIAKTEVSTFKKELASDLDTTTKMSNAMLKATGAIKSYRQEYEKLQDVASAEILKTSINDMQSAVDAYNMTDSLEQQIEAFNQYDKAKKIFDSNVKSIRTEAQAFQSAQKAQQEQINAAWTNEFQKNYKYNNGKTAQDQTVLNSMADFYRKEETEAKNFNNNMKSIYTDLVSTMKQINSLDSKINDLALKDGGSGLYKNSIASLQTQKSDLMVSLRYINEEINSAMNVQPGENGLTKFFDAARERAALTSAEIQKFDDLVEQAERNGYDFASKVTSKIQPAVEKLQSLQKLVSGGTITNSDLVSGISTMSQTLSSKMAKFKETGMASDAMDVLDYTDTISANIAALDKLAQKEAQYFASKRQYTKDSTMDGGSNMLSTDVKSTGKGLDDIQSKLNAAVKEFTKGEAIITGFKQSADGISTLDFSVFDRGTNSMRQFSMEMGQFSDKMYVTESTVSKSAKSIQAAQQQLGKMSTLMSTLGASGFNIVPETAHSSVARLHTLMQELNVAMQTGDPTTINELLQKSKLATSEVQRLYNESIKLQNAMADGTAISIGQYVDDKNIATYDQLSDAVRRHAADTDKATLSVGKFNEKQGTLNYTLTRGDGNVEHYTASINALNKTINTQQQGVTKLQTGWQHFSSVVSHSAKQMLMAFAGYNIFTQAIQTVRQGVAYIKEIDTAMTELKKVTDETEASYAKFLSTASQTGSQIGATVSDYVNATADFARLGYSMNEAGKMAEAAIVYKNVADGLDTVEAATESITSTMKAFGIESSDTMGIIDSFNEVGNNFAITSAGIGEALKRSASALAEGGNTMQESIGLITGANTVVNLCLAA